MTQSIAAKFIAFVLAAVFLVSFALSLSGIALLGYNQLYDTSLQEVYEENLRNRGLVIARDFVRGYLASTQGGCPETVLEEFFGDSSASKAMGSWNGLILQGENEICAVTDAGNTTERFEYVISVDYPSVLAPEGKQVRSSEEGDYKEGYQSSVIVLEEGEFVEYKLYYYPSAEYTVIMQLTPAYPEGSDWAMLELLYSNRYLLIAAAALSLLFFAASFVFMCCIAGRVPGSDAVRPGGLNRLPLDVYALGLAGIGTVVSVLGLELLEWSYSGTLNQNTIILIMMITVILCLLVLAFLFSLAAQLKARGGYWWRNSLIGRFLLLLFHALRWMFRGIGQLLSMLPLVWQWLICAGSLGIGLMFVYALAYQTSDILWDAALIVIPGVYIAMICYSAYAFGTLLKGVRKMNSGDLNHQIPTRFLVGAFRDFGEALNSLSESAKLAAQKELRSERMKTELITNVSHDIKTPLTSIINYVDLLQKPHTPEDETQYLEVLSRQSLRLKKLIEDLVEMSKASTGNLTVDIASIDAVEAVNQALGEFSGKLTDARLTPVFQAPEEAVLLKADGRLVWRVLSNLLSNAVKYSLPGTRLYLDVTKSEGFVCLSIKNVSREQLGISAQELLERFVRGAASRNTEGSGLGLNIAQSLMEVQHGQLQLLVDGDLFKVTLLFPEA